MPATLKRRVPDAHALSAPPVRARVVVARAANAAIGINNVRRDERDCANAMLPYYEYESYGSLSI